MKTHHITGGGGTKLQVLEAGVPAGKPILFIHGFSQCSLAWTRQLNSGLARDFRLLALDLRGHGSSDKPADAYGDSQLWAEDVQAVISTLGLDKPVLCGWSYGGLVISDYVKSYGEDQIAGTSWVGATTRLGDAATLAEIFPSDFLALAPTFFSADVVESVTGLTRFITMCLEEEPPSADFYAILGFNVSVPPHVRQGLLCRNIDNGAVLAAMKKPVLLSYGDRDKILLPGVCRQMAGLAKHARLSLYSGTGHAPFWQAAERFNRELAEFRASV
jgi:pimeloyl-ACP methyl ester carboxylesterase